MVRSELCPGERPGFVFERSGVGAAISALDLTLVGDQLYQGNAKVKSLAL
jgi:hypothetical protein